MNCPICKKIDIGKEPDICPQCNADLRILNNLDQLRSSLSTSNYIQIKKTKGIYISIALLCFFLLSILFVLSSLNDKDNKIAQLHSAINNYKVKVEKYNSKPSHNITANGFAYSVKKGDSLWKVSKLFYGSGSHYLKIREANSLSSDNLWVGQLLFIPSNN